MASPRKHHSAEIKAKVALEAIKGVKTTNEIASEYGVHPTQISQWKKQVLDELPEIFTSKRGERNKSEEELTATLYQEIGQLKMQLDWLKKNQVGSLEQKRRLIEPDHADLSIATQCQLLNLARSSYSYHPVGETEDNLHLMRLLDEQYTRTPFYGIRKMTAWLQTQGYAVNHKRVARLMRTMGLETIYSKPRMTMPGDNERIYPYLLRNLTIDRPNYVWSTDITYIRTAKGFVYLIAVLDWFSRYVLSWELSVTLDVTFCLEALEQALRLGHPEIFNTDQGVQFTSAEFTQRLEAEQIRISHDGRGRALDNIFVERLWRSVKYEEVYLKEYDTVPTARRNLQQYFAFYNNERLHQALDYRTPTAVHYAQ